VNSARLWILILTLVSFLGGIGTGLIVAERSHQGTLAQRPGGEFEKAFAGEFELDPNRQRLLAGLLDHYNSEVQAIEDRYAAEYHMKMEPELRSAGLEYRALVRDLLLPEEQRPKFDRLMAPHVENF